MSRVTVFALMAVVACGGKQSDSGGGSGAGKPGEPLAPLCDELCAGVVSCIADRPGEYAQADADRLCPGWCTATKQESYFADRSCLQQRADCEAWRSCIASPAGAEREALVGTICPAVSKRWIECNAGKDAEPEDIDRATEECVEDLTPTRRYIPYLEQSLKTNDCEALDELWRVASESPYVPFPRPRADTAPLCRPLCARAAECDADIQGDDCAPWCHYRARAFLGGENCSGASDCDTFARCITELTPPEQSLARTSICRPLGERYRECGGDGGDRGVALLESTCTRLTNRAEFAEVALCMDARSCPEFLRCLPLSHRAP